MPSLINNLYQFGEFRLDTQNRVLRRGQEIVPLTPKAFEVLLVLLQNSGQVVTKDELMKAVWPDSFVEESNLTQTIFVLRKALGENLDQRYILTVQGRGYRFAVDVKEISSGGAKATDERLGAGAPVPPPGVEKPAIQELRPGSSTRTSIRRSSRTWLVYGALSILLVAALAGWVMWSRSRSQQPLTGKVMLAVLPFENLTGDAGQDYTSDGLTEEMISQLGNLDPQRLGVIARTSVMHYKGSRTPLNQIGQELGVQYVIEGSVRRDSGRIRISAQLIQMKDQTHVWARQYDRELKDLLAVQAEIAEEIAGEIQLTLGGQHQLSAAHRTVSASASTSYEAYDLYLKGLYFWNKRTGGGFHQAADYFQQAIAKDPNYARAYAGLANTFGLMSTWTGSPPNEFMPKARAAAMKALELDQGLAEAHTALAFVAESYDYDWQTADKEFRQAIDLDPGYATAHQWYAEYLSWMGRFDEALSESEQARKLDPLSLIIASDRGAVLYRARQYGRAIAQFRAVLDMDPHFAHPRGYLLISYIRAGRFTDALDEINRYTRPLSPAWAAAEEAIVYGEWGRTAEAGQALAKFEEYAQKFPPDPYARLPVYIGTGQKDQATALLQKAFAERSPIVSTFKTDPAYDPLRGDPRFQELLRRAGLAQ
jgi:TolB-like protein/DNA-binding winged helix-turn-helix (wHTH) protein/Tfp pilus assembly protein PilF